MLVLQKALFYLQQYTVEVTFSFNQHKLSLQSKRYSLGFAQGGSYFLHREACYWARSEQ